MLYRSSRRYYTNAQNHRHYPALSRAQEKEDADTDFSDADSVAEQEEDGYPAINDEDLPKQEEDMCFLNLRNPMKTTPDILDLQFHSVLWDKHVQVSPNKPTVEMETDGVYRIEVTRGDPYFDKWIFKAKVPRHPLLFKIEVGSVKYLDTQDMYFSGVPIGHDPSSLTTSFEESAEAEWKYLGYKPLQTTGGYGDWSAHELTG